jgi:hypothetical protein
MPSDQARAPDQAELDARVAVGRLARAVREPAIELGRRTLGAGLAGALVTVLVVGATGDPLSALAAGIVAMVGIDLVAWRPLRDPGLRGAVELLSDHDCHERAEWQAETGTKAPATVAAMTRWLTTHPTGPGRAALLLGLGRLDEAEREIDRIEPKTPEEAFGVDILRASRAMYAGQRPDTTDLHERWTRLPDPRERRHRRECLALLDAQIAAADGRDPLPILAIGRREVGEVHPSMRIERLVGRWALIGLGLVVIATALAAVAVRPQAIFS